MIKFGNEALNLGYATEIELPELSLVVKEKSNYITELLAISTEVDQEVLQYNRLVKSVREIELTVEDPGLRLLKMHNLAKRAGEKMTVNLLEAIYFSCDSHPL